VWLTLRFVLLLGTLALDPRCTLHFSGAWVNPVKLTALNFALGSCTVTIAQALATLRLSLPSFS